MNFLFALTVSLLFFKTAISQEQNNSKKWVLNIVVTDSLHSIHEKLKNDKRIVGKDDKDITGCTNCFSFKGSVTSGDWGLEVTPDSAQLKFYTMQRTAYKTKAKKRIDDKHFSGMVWECRILYFFADKKALQNAYKLAEKDFTENLPKNTGSIPSLYEDGDKKKFKGIAIEYEDNSSVFIHDSIHQGKNIDNMFVLIISREASF